MSLVIEKKKNMSFSDMLKGEVAEFGQKSLFCILQQKSSSQDLVMTPGPQYAKIMARFASAIFRKILKHQ